MLRRLATTFVPRGAVTARETFEPLLAAPEAEPVLQVAHHFGAGVYAKESLLPAGWSMGKHVHAFDHLSILGSGTARLLVDGVAREVTGPACILVQAGKTHEVHAVTDITWFCVHATDKTDPDVIDEDLTR